MGERHKERVRIVFEVDIEWTDTAREWAVDAAIRHCKSLNAMGAGVKGGYSAKYATAEEAAPERDRVADALAAVLGPEPVEL